MVIYPAIDLYRGKCVRLYQGNYQKETIYHNEPFSLLDTFSKEGVNWIHLIDLEGAQDPNKNQMPLIIELIKQSKLNIQTGGGIRTQAQITTLLDQGAARVIIGSLAVQNPDLVKTWFKIFNPEQLVLALDVIYEQGSIPFVATNGWQQVSKTSIFDLLEFYQAMGLRHFLCTNISNDGTLKGPDVHLYQTLLARFPSLQLQASGGVSCRSDLQQLKALGVAGTIMGRAFYEKKITLEEALTC